MSNLDNPYENTRSKKKMIEIDFTKYGKSYQKKVTYPGLYKLFKEYDKLENQLSDTDSESDYIDSENESEEEYHYTEKELKYLGKLTEIEKTKLHELEKTIEEYDDKKIPLRFKILKSDMDMETKQIILSKLDLSLFMSENDSEYFKLNSWFSEIEKLPWGKLDNSISNITIEKGLSNCHKYLNEAVFGHKEAKLEILKFYAQYFSNPNSKGNTIALQGPMGNGKTTLIKNGLCKALNRPFYFIALGGATHASTLGGWSYTFEGAQTGLIVKALQKTGVENPIIYFDELDKVSTSEQGIEIYNILCHITDPSQNNEFEDKYLSNIKIDLSKVIFVFSFNDITKINPILLDRLKVIHTDGFDKNDKIMIAKNYLLPQIYNNIGFDSKSIKFSDEIIYYIIEKFTIEKGVRTLKKNLENIISLMNLILLSKSSVDILPIKNIKFPITLNKDIVDKILKKKDNENLYNMYI